MEIPGRRGGLPLPAPKTPRLEKTRPQRPATETAVVPPGTETEFGKAEARSKFFLVNPKPFLCQSSILPKPCPATPDRLNVPQSRGMPRSGNGLVGRNPCAIEHRTTLGIERLLKFEQVDGGDVLPGAFLRGMASGRDGPGKEGAAPGLIAEAPTEDGKNGHRGEIPVAGVRGRPRRASSFRHYSCKS
jgi:hypothetical protein